MKIFFQNWKSVCIEREFQGLVPYLPLACLKGSHFQAPCSTVYTRSLWKHLMRGTWFFSTLDCVGVEDVSERLHLIAAHCLELG